MNRTKIFPALFCLTWFLCFLKAYGQLSAPQVDSLIKKAKEYYPNNCKEGIRIAEQALFYSLQQRLSVQECESLKLISRLHCGLQEYNIALALSSEGLKVARNNHIDSLTGDFYMIKGWVFSTRNNYDTAINAYQDALAYYQKNNLLQRTGNTLLSIGICQKKLSRFADANQYYFKAANVFITLKDDADLADTYNSIALCFLALKDFDRAMAYNLKALKIRQDLKNTMLIAQSLNNIGFVYKEYNKPDMAIPYLAKCIAIWSTAHDSSLLILPLQNMGTCLLMKRDLSLANRYLMRSLRIATSYNMPEDMADINIKLSRIYIHYKKYKQALSAIVNAEHIAKQLHMPSLLVDAYIARISLYKAEGNYKAALEYDTKKDLLHDTIFTLAQSKTINQLEIGYQTKQKEQSIISLNRQNALEQKVVGVQKRSIILLIAGAALLLLLLIILYRGYLEKKQAGEKIRLLNAELNHRIKNNMAILQGIFILQIQDALSDERTKDTLRQSEARLTSMNLVHQQLFMSNDTTAIPMREYLSQLLEHVKAAFATDNQKDITLRVNVEDISLQADKAVAIGLIINELATNSFKYAFDANGGEISLTLIKEDSKKLLLTFSDNGRGISTARKQNETSFGLKLVNLMARQLNASLSTHAAAGTVYQLSMVYP